MGFFDGFIEFFEAFVLRGEAAFRGSVYDEDDFAFVFFQRDWLAFLCLAYGSA